MFFGEKVWTIAVLAFAAMVATPIFVVFGNLFVPTGEVWDHLATTVLPSYIGNSLWLMFGVGLGVAIVGVAAAWLVTMCRFPGSLLLEWLLLLPLAIPAYLLAYIYTDLLAFYGPVQSWLRELWGWQSESDYWFPNLRSLGGAIAMLVLVLYPYVYLLARTAFLEQSTCTLEASRSLGCSPWRSFWTVALPLARPAIAAGLSLALMETLNDYGTVQFFGVDTFTTGIYRTWFGMGEPVAAAQLSAVLTMFVLWLILWELYARRQSRYYQSLGSRQPFVPYQLRGWRASLAGLTCLLPVTLGFLVPTGLLIHMVATNLESTVNASFWQLSRNSFFLATLTAGLGVAIALVLSYGERLCPNWGIRLAVRIAAMGYAIPGSVIAVGIMVPLGRIDNAIAAGLVLSGTVAALIFAYLVRFLAVSLNAVSASLSKIQPNLDWAARSLGRSPAGTLRDVHIPMLRSGLLTAAMLVFVDVMKELPATVAIRPFNFDTLAIRVYHYASDERLVEASAPALAIVLVGIVPVILLSRQLRRARV